jgi:hypothetical protein
MCSAVVFFSLSRFDKVVNLGLKISILCLQTDVIVNACKLNFLSTINGVVFYV